MEKILCDYCGSDKVIKNGNRNCKKGKVQTYFCNHCKRKFSLGGEFKKIMASPEIHSVVLDLYYSGISTRNICRHLLTTRNVKVSHSTILRWIYRAIDQIGNYVDTLVPIVGDEWNTDETYFPVPDNYHRSLWLVNTFDKKTKFLITSHPCETRTQEEIELALRLAKFYASKTPAKITTDSLGAYPAQIAKVFYSRSIHNQARGLTKVPQNNPVERLHGEMKMRYKTMRGFDGFKTGSKLMKGFFIFYNFVKPHSAIGYKTPAEAAKIDFPEYTWRFLLENSREPIKMGATYDNCES